MTCRTGLTPAGCVASSDLLDHYRVADGFLFTRNRDGMVATGSAAHAVVEAGPAQGSRAATAADSLLRWADGAAGAMVVGALPFDGTLPALLTLPSRMVHRARGSASEVVLPGESSSPLAALTGVATLDGNVPRSDPPRSAYLAAVAEALRRIRGGDLYKVVLARSLVLPALSPDALTEVLRRMRTRDPHSRLFAALTPPPRPGGAVGLVAGATPELLLRRRGNEVVSRPLAGTAPRSADTEADMAAAERLRRSSKNSTEHRIVVEAVADALAPFCSELTVDRQPSLERTAVAWHLATTVRGVLRPQQPSALALAAAVHPTPAVGGTPQGVALRAIADLEAVPRGFYAGYIGWVDEAGDGEWAVCLRCLETGEKGTRLFAGAGIVEGSDPVAELAETDVKFRTLLDALSPR